MAITGTAAALRAATRQRTVLVVEDEAAIRDLLRLHLRNAGYSVVVAEDAIEAGKRLLENPSDFDLIVIDAQLPYLSGIEFASTLIADTTLPALPIILITGHEELVPRAERLDVPCLVKPFSAQRFISLVESTAGTPDTAAAIVEARGRLSA